MVGSVARRNQVPILPFQAPDGLRSWGGIGCQRTFEFLPLGPTIRSRCLFRRLRLDLLDELLIARWTASRSRKLLAVISASAGGTHPLLGFALAGLSRG